MTRIYDLAAVQSTSTEVTDESVLVISNGVLTQKITVSQLKTVLVSNATTDVAGLVRVGAGLDINNQGVLSVKEYSGYTLPIASDTTLGGVKVGSGLAISSTGELRTIYPMIPATTSAFGFVKIGSGINVNDGTISVPPVIFNIYDDAGLTVGNDSDLTISIVNGNIPTFSSISSLVFGINGGSIKLVPATTASATGGTVPSLVPSANLAQSLGTPGLQWKTVHADSFVGDITGVADKATSLFVQGGTYRLAMTTATANTIAARNASGDLYADVFYGNLTGIATKADTLKVGSVYASTSVDTADTGTASTIVVRDSNGAINATAFNGPCTRSNTLKVNAAFFTAAITPTASTIAARDSSGNLSAVNFIGVASTATYADLAEKYLADAEYDEGTVVVFGGSKEITVTNVKADHRVAGVVSKFPAYLMNSSSDGTPVALRGKVPVKVLGKVEKGDLLVSSAVPGYAMSVKGEMTWGSAVFAKSLENKIDLDRGVVMAVIL